MKFLDLPALTRLNAFLDNVDAGELVVRGNLEAFSCKLAGLDKKLSRSLEDEVAAARGSPAAAEALGKSPVGPLADSGSRRTLVYLILTLNHIYPDYDFSLLRAHHFRKEAGAAAVDAAVEAHLFEAGRAWEAAPGRAEGSLADALAAALEEAIEPAGCDVYSYQSDLEGDPFGERGSVWSFNLFLYNRRLKRILYFSCRGLAKSAVEGSRATTSLARYNSDGEGEESVSQQMAGTMDL